MHNPAHVIQGTVFVDLQHRPSMTSEIAAYGCSWTENRYVKTKQEYLHGELSSAHDLSAKCMYLQRKSRSHGVYRVGDGACSVHCVWGDWEGGPLFKPNAHTFLRDAFGRAAEIFARRLSCVELMADLEESK